MLLSEWTHVGSAGQISNLPASAWEYKYSLQQIIPVLVPLLDGTMIKGKWTLSVLGPDEAVLFRQSVEISVLVVTLNLGVVFYVAIPIGAVVSTIYPDEVPMLGTPDGILMTDPETSTYGLNEFYLYLTWQSPIYQIPLPAGARFHVTFHNIGWPTMPGAYAPFWTRTAAGGAWAAARCSQLGMAWVATAGATGVDIVGAGDIRALDGQAAGEVAFPWAASNAALLAPLAGRIPASGPSKPVLLNYPHQRTGFILVWQEGQAVRAAYSHGSGQALTWGDPAVVVSGYSLLAACMMPDGSGVFMIGSGAEGVVGIHLGMRFDGGEVALEAGEPWPLALTDGTAFPTLPNQLHQLVLQAGSAWLLVSAGSGRTEIYHSADLHAWMR